MNRYIFSFFIFSFLGWIWESIYCTIDQKKWANRGFLYGPICPIYGFGSVLGLIFFDLSKINMIPPLNYWQIFLIGFLMSMILEYPTSYVLEKLFHARWWDYSNVFLNIDGRTSVPTSLAFGLGAIVVMEFIIPYCDSKLINLSDILLNILTLLFVSLISIDLTLTISALTDFQKRVEMLDSNFQQHMINTVNNFYATTSYFHKHALDRIVKIKYTDNKKLIATKIIEKKIEELFK